MFPIRDNIPSRTFPFVNYGLIAACSVVFLLQLSSREEGQTIVEQFGIKLLEVLRQFFDNLGFAHRRQPEACELLFNFLLPIRHDCSLQFWILGLQKLSP